MGIPWVRIVSCRSSAALYINARRLNITHQRVPLETRPQTKRKPNTSPHPPTLTVGKAFAAGSPPASLDTPQTCFNPCGFAPSPLSRGSGLPGEPDEGLRGWSGAGAGRPPPRHQDPWLGRPAAEAAPPPLSTLPASCSRRHHWAEPRQQASLCHRASLCHQALCHQA